jgi:Predicted nuclease of the RecB family
MPIYEITSDHLKKIEETTFSAAGKRERTDLQRLLRKQIEIIAPDVLVIAEEFGDWDDSRRRIDLLGIDKDANLVVIELKRTEDGGHMELQALRYAAMVSTMTFEEAVTVYGDYIGESDQDIDPQQELLDFLGDEMDEEHFAQDVGIILVSAEFSKELTSSVLWLNDFGLDIRCVRIKPYNDNGRTLIDVQQVIPLPEATEYQVKVSVKTRRERTARTFKKDLTKYDMSAHGLSKGRLATRDAIFYVVQSLCDHGIAPAQIAELIPWRSNRVFLQVEGMHSSEEFIKLANAKLEANGKAFDPNRWYCKEGELIIQNGNTFAFSSKWGIRWMQAVKILKKEFPEANIEYQASQQNDMN